MSEILDSGSRREFASGAVRDIDGDNKGRCDLLPLDVVSSFLGKDTLLNRDVILMAINNFVRKGEVEELYRAVGRFCIENNLDPYTAMLELSIHYKDGASKYSERNWEKGIDLHCFIDSGVRHYLKFRRGDTDEPHNRAFIWNMFGAIWTYTHRPECIDLPFDEKVKINVKEELDSIRSEIKTARG